MLECIEMRRDVLRAGLMAIGSTYKSVVETERGREGELDVGRL